MVPPVFGLMVSVARLIEALANDSNHKLALTLALTLALAPFAPPRCHWKNRYSETTPERCTVNKKNVIETTTVLSHPYALACARASNTSAHPAHRCATIQTPHRRPPPTIQVKPFTG